MKSALKPLFALLALAAAMCTLTFGCSKPADDTQSGPPAGNNTAKPSDGGAAAPPKTHD